jgi:hypothetical protein
MKLFMKLQWGGNLQGLENERSLGEKTSKLQLGACGSNKMGSRVYRNCKIPLQELDKKIRHER